MMQAAARGLARAREGNLQARALHGLASASSRPAEPPTLPPCSFQPQPYESMSHERMCAVRSAHLNPALVSHFSRPLLLHQGHMQWLWDEHGRRYLDFFAGIVTVSVGHCHPTVTRAAKAQLSRLWHSTNIYLHPPVHEYAEKLAALLPEPLKVIYFTNSGSEANDLAMFMARAYTGNFDILSFRGGYHGASPYTMGLTNVGSYKYSVPNGFGCHAVMCPDVYRGLWGGAHCRDSPVQTTRSCACAHGSCQAQDNYLEQLAEVFATSVPKKVAGFFAESIQGVGGSVQYPRGYLAEAYRMVRARGGLCIADEVQTGFGRLGSHMWGFESHGVVPDIVTMAKGIGNGFPLAAVVTSAEVASVMSKALHFNTFGGSPLACAVGSAVLDVIKEDGTQAVCSEVGGRLLAGLARFRDEFEVVGDVRGKGLMIGVELVTDKASRTPLPAAQINEIWEDCREMSLLIGKGGVYGQVFRIKPPMCITTADVDFALAVMHRALSKHRERHAA